MSLPVGKHISMAPAILPSDGLRQVMFGVTFAFLVAPNSVLILYFGLTGSSGNSLATAALLTIAAVAAGLLCILAFTVLLSLAQGRISRDGVLFALLGCVVGLKETFRASAPATSAAVA